MVRFRQPFCTLVMVLACGILRPAIPAPAEQAAGRLPEIQAADTANFLPAIREQIQQAEKAVQEHPRDPVLAGQLGMTLHAYELYEPAARAYERAHVLDPQNPDWLYLLGAAQMARGAFDASVESFQQSLRLRPKDAAATLRLAQSLTALARYEEARAVYRQLLDAQPNSAQAWYGLGRVEAAAKDHPAAATALAKACELSPAYGAAHFALASELRRLRRQAEAEAHLASYAKNVTTEPPLDDPLFLRIHELNRSVQLHIQRGAELEKAGKLQEAISEHEAALVADPRNLQAHINLIALYARAGESVKAKQHFDAATSLNANRPDAWYDYGVLLFGQRNYAEAEQAFRRALSINPQYAEAHNNLGAIYEQQSKLDEAAQEFRDAIAERPDYPLARFHLARILVNRENYDEAIQQLQRAIEPETDQTPVYLYALGAAYARAGKRTEAVAYLRKAHDAAGARGQSQLLASIDRDLKSLAGEP